MPIRSLRGRYTGPGPVIDVLVVDDHRAFADAISLAVNREEGLRCVGTVGSVEDAVDAVETSCPSVVLLDLNLPGSGGLEAIGPLRASCPDLRIIVLTADTSVRTVLDSVEAGADAFLPKERRFADLIEAVRDEDAVPFNAEELRRLLLAAKRSPDVRSGRQPPELTDREREVLLLLAAGEPAKSVARLLDISVHTCRGHVRSLLSKFDAHSQLQVVLRAARCGMLPDLEAREP